MHAHTRVRPLTTYLYPVPTVVLADLRYSYYYARGRSRRSEERQICRPLQTVSILKLTIQLVPAVLKHITPLPTVSYHPCQE